MILLIELTFFSGLKRFGYIQTSLTVNDLTSVNSLPAAAEHFTASVRETTENVPVQG